MFATYIVTGIFLALAAMLPGQALAQLYRPHGFDSSNEVVRLEIEEGFDAFGDRPAGSPGNAKKERQSGAWTMFGRLGLVSFETRAGHPDDGFTLRRSGPKLGRLTIGIRKRF